MSYLSYPAFPRENSLTRRSIGTPPPVNAVESDAARALSVGRGHRAAFPFPADSRGFNPRIPDIASALYGLPYGNHSSLSANPLSSAYPGLPPGIDAATLQATFSRMEPKDIPSAWRPPQHPLYAYDPALTSLVYQGGYGPLALADGARRKNATRETTSTLKAWLNEHRKNPYPTKGEKIMLAIMSKMTLTQVSTWFANARRRLKKENRMTWSPRNRCSDDRESGDEDADPGLSTSSSKNADEMDASSTIHHKEEDRDDDPPQSDSNDIEQGGIPYQQYQQQMFLRHLVSLPPQMRTPEAFRHYQELQLRSRWAASRAPDRSRATSPNGPSHSHQFVPQPDQPSSSGKIDRRSSIGSPSTSSYDRSPSPHRPCASGNTRGPPALEPVFPRRCSPAPPKVPKFSPKHFDCKNDEARPRAKSLDTQAGTKQHKIWSPVNMTNDKPTSGQITRLPNTPPSNGQVSPFDSHDSSSEKPRLSSASEGLNRDVIHMRCESNSRLDDKSIEEVSYHSPPTSPELPKPSPASVAHAWMREYQRHLGARNPVHPQHALAATLASFAVNKDAGRLLGSSPGFPTADPFNRHPYRAPFALPDLLVPFKVDHHDNDESLLRHGDMSDEELNSDAPMNLSKNTRHSTDDSPFKTDAKINRKPRIPSIIAN